MITINASRKYDITVTESWDTFKETVDAVAKGNRIMVVTDTNVERLYLTEIIRILSDGYQVFTHVVEAGEVSKTITVYSEIMEDIASLSFKRDDMIIALGGGVVGDLAAFVASTYMRGIRLVSVPTTLLSMIDSSVGGKTAVNLGVGKNLCGTFYQPFAVYANVCTLKTLPKREIACGKGELVKYALLDGRISSEDVDHYSDPEVIEKCISVKKEIVESDEFESGRRMLLNLGHTVGHALEAISEYKVPHGQCVVQGLYAVAKISKKLCDLPEEEYAEIVSILEKVAKERDLSGIINEIMREITIDKKATKDGVNVVLIRHIGDCFTQSVEPKKLGECLSDKVSE